MTPRPGTAPDRAELARLVGALSRHAEEGGTVSLRASFDDALTKRRNDPSFKIRNVKPNGAGPARDFELEDGERLPLSPFAPGGQA